MPDVPIDCSTFTRGCLIRPALLELGRQFDIWHPCVYKAKGQRESQWGLLITAEHTHPYHSYFLRPHFRLWGGPELLPSPFSSSLICMGEGFRDGDLDMGMGKGCKAHSQSTYFTLQGWAVGLKYYLLFTSKQTSQKTCLLHEETFRAEKASFTLMQRNTVPSWNFPRVPRDSERSKECAF